MACEDTRVSAGLLRHLGMEGRPLLALHEHNERSAATQVLQRLASGERVAYVSDAGTPALSDPGAALVAAVQQAGYRVLPVPGASSVAAALSVAGDAHGAGFVFLGFAPTKAGERAAMLREIAAQPARSAVLFEAPHRIEALARDLAEALPARTVALCRELTKQFETVYTLPAAALPAWLAADTNRLRGEFVLVVHATAAPDAEGDDADVLRVLDLLLAELPLKQAVSLAAAITGAKRNALYDAALARQSGQPRP